MKKLWLGLIVFFGIMAGLYAQWPAQEIPPYKADLVIIEKSARKLTLLRSNEPFAVYEISLGRVPTGPKTRQGDHKTPEGRYKIDYHKPDSAYHLALHVSYPEDKDLTSGNPGGDIMIHGIRNGLGGLGRFHRLLDWTQGCIAVTNDEIEQIYDRVPDGTPIEIKP